MSAMNTCKSLWHVPGFSSGFTAVLGAVWLAASVVNSSRAAAVPASPTEHGVAANIGIRADGKAAADARAEAGNEARTTNDAAADNPAWTEFVDRFLEEYFAAFPSFAVSQGRHEYDGRLPDWSAAGFAKKISQLHRQRRAAEKFSETGLSARQRFQRQYMLSRIDNELFWLEKARKPFVNPAYYFDNGLDPAVYVVRPYASPEIRLRAFIKYARAVPRALEQIRGNLRQPLPATFVAYGIAGFGGFVDYYRKDVPNAFAEVKDGGLQRELHAAVEPAAQAMDAMRKWLQAQPPLDAGYALGAERFMQMLQMTESVDTSLPDLEAAGRSDLLTLWRD